MRTSGAAEQRRVPCENSNVIGYVGRNHILRDSTHLKRIYRCGHGWWSKLLSYFIQNYLNFADAVYIKILSCNIQRGKIAVTLKRLKYSSCAPWKLYVGLSHMWKEGRRKSLDSCIWEAVGHCHANLIPFGRNAGLWIKTGETAKILRTLVWLINEEGVE